MWLDHCAAACLAALAIWILLSGLDDLFIDLVYLRLSRKPFDWPSPAELSRASQRRIAILLPLWHEHEVAGQMLRHNLSVIRYDKFDFFVGVYPNDRKTMRAVQAAAEADKRIHVAVCSHPGPTSKADCLNCAYERMAEHETLHDVRYETVMTHDAEDLIHPESLRLINWFSRDFQMVQVPVLPLATPLREWTHGLYCDEFAEYQCKDIPVRQFLGGFLPGNGVGTGFSRAALERLRQEHEGLAFDPSCLTEDYECGFRLHAAGFRQIFLPLRFESAEPVATREYFPRRAWAAIRQRSRWVAGIALQGWEQHGWFARFRDVYWFWRDRKGLAGNLLSPFTNFFLLSWLVHAGVRLPGPVWVASLVLPSWLRSVCLCSAGIALVQIGIRVRLSARIYGLRFAILAPLRILWGNVVNCAATIEALRLFSAAKIMRRALVWRKTDHAYPLFAHPRPRLGEVLVRLRCISAGDLDAALIRCPRGLLIGEYLVQLEMITAGDLRRALLMQTAPLTVGQPNHVVHRNFGLDST